MLPVILAIAALAAGHPVGVTCDADTNRPPTLNVPPGAILHGWSYVPSNEIHLSTDICLVLQNPPQPYNPQWAVAFMVLLHESKHAAGERREDCANLYAIASSYWLLNRYWKLPLYGWETIRIARLMWLFEQTMAPHYRIHENTCKPPPA